MRDPRLALLIVGTVSLSATRAFGQQEERKAPSLPETPDTAAAASTEDVQTQLDDLREKLRQNEEQQRKKVLPLSINGYVDFGFFAPLGNHGVGWIRDSGNQYFPEYAPYAWTFLGDILGSPVNSRGEAADLGDAPGIDRFDSIHSNGAPGFIANEVNLRLAYQAAERAIVRTSVNFVPRSPKQDFSLGDFLDVDVAELEYVVTDDGKTSVFVGKTLPVFGIEYKERKSDQRFGVTPSLVFRYTSESQLGLKARTKLLRDWIILAASVTNNSSSSEQFHFHSEIDRNSGKMLNGRVALSVPIGDFISPLAGDRFELGGSGEWGPQDWATDNAGKLWFVGADLQYLSTNFAVKGQWMRGAAPGRPEDRAWKLELHNSGYAEIDWQFLPFLGALVRADVRDAVVTLGTDRAYITKQMRVTGGIRIPFNPHIVLKLEYFHNREYGGVPQIKNDMFTSSLVLGY